jgi:ABC-type Zn uptake system ZnuABC Zn-binding protein ZnuA
MRQISAAALLIFTALAGAGAQSSRPKVAATIFPLYDIVREVAEGVADVVLILPPGASPHTFAPTPAAIRNLAGCDALFLIGHGLDDWAARLAAGAGVRRAVVVDDGIVTRRPSAVRRAAGTPHGGVDPHYWLAITNAKAIAASITKEIERLMPAQTTRLRANLDEYLVQLDAADAAVRRLLANLTTRRIATFHDAFGYFADAYGLEIVATFEPFPGTEPSPKWVEDFQRVVRATGLAVIFTEPQLSAAPLRAIARDLGVSLAILDPVGGVPGRASYVDLMLFNARQVAAASPP